MNKPTDWNEVMERQNRDTGSSFRTPQEMVAAYYEQEESAKGVARVLGLPKHVVQYFVRANAIAVPKWRKETEKIKKIIAAASPEKTVYQIAIETGCFDQGVRQVLNSRQIPYRKGKKTNRTTQRIAKTTGVTEKDWIESQLEKHGEMAAAARANGITYAQLLFGARKCGAETPCIPDGDPDPDDRFGPCTVRGPWTDREKSPCSVCDRHKIYSCEKNAGQCVRCKRKTEYIELLAGTPSTGIDPTANRGGADGSYELLRLGMV